MLYYRLQVIWANITVVGLFRGSDPVKACHMRKKKKKEKLECSAKNREDTVETCWLSGMPWVGFIG